MKSDTNHLFEEDIKTILRAADEIIAQGGRTLLAKILKGSREKKVLQLELNQCPVYGWFHSEKLEEILKKIDWMIDYDFLDIEFSGKLPMIVFTERGWEIEANQRADEFLREWVQWLEQGRPSPEMSYLKDRNRKMILLFLEKIKETKDRKYIPYLEAWEKIEYKRVKAEIRTIIHALESNEPVDLQLVQDRQELLNEALKGSAPQDIVLKCWECGKRFIFTIGEQQFYKQKGFVYPKRCEKCRDQRHEAYL
ncbi:RQC-minor-1 family DNA-binding protein [Bacillus sp. 1NLA3E]|uniref:RQC-minor-1 family DNA-binding protein n=1 Tax=Bacillus sp. 1NLA3E TaxID=666686 RepID=UPI000247F1B1|nr:RQC-minor-1 family DNA-binding protein [Bacillus sp. 1NLA3E]AGK54040.1 superfamily II DNA helicase [Bacillus sp. 1NLA3E]